MNTCRRWLMRTGSVLVMLCVVNGFSPRFEAFAQDAGQEGGEVGACCLPDGMCHILEEDACYDADGYFWGEGTVCQPNPCEFACCIPEAYNCKQETKNNCEVAGGTWLGVGVFCPDPYDPYFNPCKFGACCVPDFGCIEVSDRMCWDEGGAFQGYLTACGSFACGACCFDPYICVDSTTKQRCESAPSDSPPGLGGVWAGEGRTCEGETCVALWCRADIDDDGAIGVSDLLLVLAQWGPCPPVCVADINGDGVVNVVDLLEVLGFWGACP